MVLGEILQGIKPPREARLVRSNLESLPFVESRRKIRENAGQIYAALGKKGISIPLSNTIIASTAIIERHEIFTIDPHFEKIPDLILHKLNSN